MEIFLVVVTVVSLISNLWMAHALRKSHLLKNDLLPMTVVLSDSEWLDAEPESIAVPDPEPATDAVTESVKNGPRTVQAWVNQRGIPMAAYPSSHDAPNIPKQDGPQERPYGFVSGAIPS